MAVKSSVDMDQVRALTAEFTGTLIYLMASTLAVTTSGGDILTISSAFGLTLIVVLAMTAPVSGGHINPAVTLAMIITRNIEPMLGIGYIIAQLAGAIFGTLSAYIVTSDLKGAVAISSNTSTMGGFVAEASGTFVLVMVVFSIAVQSTVGVQSNEKVAGRAQAPLLIGMSVWAMHLMLVGYTGCGINPARWLGPAVVLNSWPSHSWIYVVGPVVGAIQAVTIQFLMFGVVRPGSVETPASGPEP